MLPKYKRFRRDKGQTALETAFVFTMLLFISLTIVNLAVLFHTKNIATYAAFMAARSYQVLGDQGGANLIQEKGKSNGLNSASQKSSFLSELDNNQKLDAALYRVAEDIFVCSLPWVKVPQDDTIKALPQYELDKNPMARCMDGNRKYKDLLTQVRFAPFKEEGIPGKKFFDSVAGGFAEQGREPLRYGVLSLRYPITILFNPFNVFDFNESDLSTKQEVNVPYLLNPSLNAGKFELEKPGDKQGALKK